MLETRERCRDRIASLKRQRVDIDATIDELESFCTILDDCLNPKED